MSVEKWKKIKENIQTVGMKTFVKYYYEFEKDTIKDILKLFGINKERWVYNAMNTKASMGKKIFKDQNQKHVLELILSSNSDKKTIETASEIYTKEYPNDEFKLIRFIRPEFEFGKEVVDKLFEGYEIIAQHKVKDYKIDWYIPELKIAIEFDEKYHDKKNQHDNIRQLEIEKELNCKFLRYKYTK